MKTITLSLFLIMISFGIYAQIDINPGTIILEGDGSDTLYLEVAVTNTNSEPVELFWIYEPAANYPSNWKTQICDSRFCYIFDKFCSLPSLPNIMEAGQEIIFKLTIINKFGQLPVNGKSYGILRLFDDPDKTNEVAVSSPVTSIIELQNDDLVIYPNPTTASFQLKNDASVSKINIYSIVGRLEKTLNHSRGMIHDVTSLRAGIYLIRLENSNGEILKSIRLSKK